MTPDVMEQPELTERQQQILALIVREYINRPEPVGSKHLSEHFLTSISSATIRNDMAALEDLGFVIAPHTSAGRIPTEAGYRYFVKHLLNEAELSPEERHTIAEKFSHAASDLDESMRLAVSTLARTSRGAALVTAPRALSNQFKHLELISTQGRLVLMVLVLYGGDVRQQMLTFTEPLTQDLLSSAARHLNAACDGLTSEQIRLKSRQADNDLERAILDIIADAIEESDTKQHPVAYREGLSEMLPEFTESEGAQQALRLMEERNVLGGVLSETLDEHIGRVQVVIGGEGRWEELRHLSIVFSRYGVHGQATGSLVVFGPTRMRYGRAIPAVRYIAGLMSSMLVDVYGAEKPDADSTNSES